MTPSRAGDKLIWQQNGNDVLAGAWVSQAERAATIAADRLYLTQVILAQGLDAPVDLQSSRQASSLEAAFLTPVFLSVGEWTRCPTS